MKKGFWRIAFGVASMSSVVGAVYAGEVSPRTDENCFASGKFEGSFGQTLMYSPMIGTHRPPVDYTCTEIEVGYLLTDPNRPGFLRGNVEVLGSLFGGGIFYGRGDYLIGSTGWLRYNFLQPNDPFVPFAQIGLGITETDLDRRLEGQNFNFNVNASVGTRYRITRDWSINVECRYQHTSNAHMAHPNLGIDAIGPVVSVSYFF